ncbi:MAG: substrate-binding domain-containing protein [Phycisphaerales bacterium JB063]
MTQTHANQTRGTANTAVVLVLASVVALAVLVAAALALRGQTPLVQPGPATQDDAPLRLYCAAGIKPTLDKILQDYEARYGVSVEVHAQGSGTLFGQINTEAAQGQGPDLYISAEGTYLDQGHAAGTLAEVIPIGTQRPVLIVAPGNPKHINSLTDLADPARGIDFGIANEGAAVGKKTRAIAEAMGVLDAIEQNRKTEQETVVALVDAVRVGALDAAVVWDTIAAMTDGVEIVEDPHRAFKENVSQIGIAVVSTTDRPTEALRLARFIAARDEGLEAFARDGFEVASGDAWAEHPRIVLYCGSMFRAVFEDTLEEFSEREGVTIDPQWAGCGKLVAQMSALLESGVEPEQFPSAYLACDVQFYDAIHEYNGQRVFGESTIVSENDIIIAVAKGNPFDIQTPEDLLKPGVRVGVCHPTESALGTLTRQMLSSERFNNIYGRVQAQKSVEVDVGPTLVSQILARGLDAVIVYRSNVMSSRANLDELEIVEIQDGDSGLTRAIQPWSIAEMSEHKELMRRLFALLSSEQSRARFESAGFHWRDPR